MQNNGSKSKKLPKFRLLLDVAFAEPEVFRKLCQRAIVKHARHDLKLSGQTEDEEIFQRALHEDMFVVTINYKDFKRLIRKEDKPGIIGLDSGLTNEQMEKALLDFIRGKDPREYYGKAIRL